MQRPNLSPIALAAIAGLVLVVAGLAALVVSQPPPTVDPLDGPRPAPSRVALIGPGDCALQKQPGAEDTVPGPGEMDVGDLGNGRWRLCLMEPISLEIEGSAWCSWNDDRSMVREVAGLQIAAGLEKLDGGVALDRAAVFLSRTPANSDIVSYESSDPSQIIEPADGGRTGAARFRLEAFVDPEHPPAVRPPSQAGTLRWTCGPAPAPRPGRSTGQATLRLDAPVGLSWDVPVACSWWSSPAGGILRSFETVTPIPVGDLHVSFRFDPDIANPDIATAGINVSTDVDSGDYQSSGSLISTAQSPDGATGVLRLRHMSVAPESNAKFGPNVNEIGGVIRWSCPPPAVQGPPDPDVGRPVDPLVEVPGRAQLDFSPAVVNPLGMAITCALDLNDPGYVRVALIDGRAALGGGTVLLHSDAGAVRLALIGGDALPAGEYRGNAFEMGDDVIMPGLYLRVEDLTWDTDDPRYVPLGGAAAPRAVGLRIDYACDISGIELPGMSFGQMDLVLASGINQTWSVASTCSWRLRNGRPMVTEVVNGGLLEVNNEPFRAYATPEILFVVSRFGTRYGELRAATVQGRAAPDGSTGTWTFTGIGPRGRITNINGRLGGRDGPLSVDGSIAWTCGRPPREIPPEPPPPN